MCPINHIRSARDTIRHPSGLIQCSFFRATTVTIREMMAADRRTLDCIRQELALMENARLCIHHHGDAVCFGVRKPKENRETGISRDRNRIHQLARRTYLLQRIAMMEQQLLLLQRLADHIEDAREQQRFQAKLQRYADAGLDLGRVIFSPEQNDWIDQPFSPNPHHPENLKYPTDGGYLMRSKSEAKLGSALEGIGLPYRSDDLVTIHAGSVGPRPFRDSYFADFKLPNLLGGITVHEHLGAFQIDRYADDSLKRLNDYHDFAVYELPERPVSDDELTWSFEGDVHEQVRLERLIRRMLLPGAA